MTLDTEEREGPIWDPIQQIYIGGVPENAAVRTMIESNGGTLTLFGYGSLCWNPGIGALAHPLVTHTPGKAKQYRRCWCQKSTDHRGNTNFPGIVCTLLEDDEFRAHSMRASDDLPLPSYTEGVLYRVPPELVDECLDELDFREKGGYARDIIEVVDDATGKVEQALLYRGTPDNPAFWPRALRDPSFAAAVMAVAVGPSGDNHVYLDQLDAFLESTPDAQALKQFDDTLELAAMSNDYRRCDLHFFAACGSNQHNQLLLKSSEDSLVGKEDAHELCECFVCLPAPTEPKRQVRSIHAGGGHSGMVMDDGSLYLFGWNQRGQLGCDGKQFARQGSVAVLQAVPDLRVEQCSLGFEHTLVIEQSSRRVFSFGSNSKGQTGHEQRRPATPPCLRNVAATCVSAGIFHSTVVDKDGCLHSFGWNKYGQVLDKPWRPDDGAKVVQAVCGRHHTVVLDDQSRVWAFGENKHHQLGQLLESNSSSTPLLVSGPWEEARAEDIRLRCGWSHSLVLVGTGEVYGWGRNDKKQLGAGDTKAVKKPRRILEAYNVVDVQCGSESTVVADAAGDLWACGWNEHGNLGTGSNEDALGLTRMQGALPTLTPGYPESQMRVACGGAHVIAMNF